MSGVLGTVLDNYHYIVNDLADRRTDDYILASSPWGPIGVFIIYLLLIKKILPAYMKNREAFKLDKLVLFYNFTQIYFNAYLLYWALPRLKRMSLLCTPVDYSDGPDSRLDLDVTYLYFILKIYDLLDTVFFVLRKKERQITFLHIYHHGMMVTLPWIPLRYVPGGQLLYIGFFNTIVHIVMYFYYGYSLYNSGSKNSIWWKKYITQLQLTQFILLLIMGIVVFLNPTCNWPKGLLFLGIIQNIILLYLFGSFYYKTYHISPTKKPTDAEKKVE